MASRLGVFFENRSGATLLVVSIGSAEKRGQAAARVERTDGGVAQLGEHLLCKQGVVGSIPSASTSLVCV